MRYFITLFAFCFLASCENSPTPDATVDAAVDTNPPVDTQPALDTIRMDSLRTDITQP